MLLNLKTDDRYFHAKAPYLLAPAAIGLAYLLFLLVRSPFGGSRGDASPAAILLNGDAHAIGIKMFSEYLLQFEIIGVFLTGAIVGAIVLAKTPKSIETRRDA
jgi:NADH-quinone oxidoreductase subunit J